MKISLQKQLNLADGENRLLFNADFADKKITALYGPSGAGKTSVLRMIAGLMNPEKGYVEVDGEIWLDTGNNINLPPQKRSVGFVFQDFALFPNMTVLDHLRFASTDAVFTDKLLALSGLKTFIKSKPAQLSGGQKQRLAFIRALARKPKLLLLDEPLSAQDAENRKNLWGEISLLQNEWLPTTVLVSHDEQEIRTLSQELIQLKNGKIIATGTPDAFFTGTFQQQKIRLKGVITEIVETGNGDRVTVIASGNTFVFDTDSAVSRNLGDEISFETDVLDSRIITDK